MNTIIELRNISHSFVAWQNVLNNVSLQIPKGSIYGLLGRNGAGKNNLHPPPCRTPKTAGGLG